MRIVCTKSNLVKGVSIVSKAVPSKTTMPILECILVDASGMGGSGTCDNGPFDDCCFKCGKQSGKP